MLSRYVAARHALTSVSRPSRYSRGLRRLSLLTSAAFLWTSLLATPAQVLAHDAKPAFPTPKPLPPPVVHDDSSWHTIDYHKAERGLSAANKTGHKPGVRVVSLSLLDEVGHLAQPVEGDRVATWKRELHQGMSGGKVLSASGAAMQHVWLGEVALAQDEQPLQAHWHFAQAQKLSKKTEVAHGLAAYDNAITLFYEGAYGQAKTAFADLMRGKSGGRGYDRRACALFAHHANTCAGYHAERSAVGIPEPPRIDPLCAAAALAQSLKTLHKPYDKKTVLANLRVTGRGSNLNDVLRAAKQLGLAADVVSTDDKGLIALPKPLIAHVEHDHFISVLEADKAGVAYMCSDCGAWPGGRVRLSWTQWHKLEATVYTLVSLPTSDVAQVMRQLERQQNGQSAGAQLASSSPTLPQGAVTQTNLLRTLRNHVRVQCGQGSTWPQNRGNVSPPQCGQTPSGLKCQCSQCPAVDTRWTGADGDPSFGHITANDSPADRHGVSPPPANPAAHKSPVLIASASEPNRWGAQAGDPVNLATGEEDYTPAADLVVYNPLGPSLAWSRLYDSLRPDGVGTGYQSVDFGTGWSHAYNIGVIAEDSHNNFQGNVRAPRNVQAITPSDSRDCGQIGIGGGGTATATLLEPNGARVALTASGYPSATNPHVTCAVQAGLPFLVDWYYNSADATTYFVITNADRSQWSTQGSYDCVTNAPGQHVRWHPLTQVTDSSGNAITFHYTTPAANAYPLPPVQFPLLTDIVDKNNVALLTVSRDANNGVQSVSDRYGRCVYYHVGTYATGNVPVPYTQSQQELDHVSQVVLTGAANPPDRYVYGYSNVGNGDMSTGVSETIPLLHTITVPSPTGTGTQTALINYENNTVGVASLVDANGNQSSYKQIDANHTQVILKDANGNILYRYTVGYDMNMSKTTTTNGVVDANGNNTQVVSSETYADPNNPYRPSQVQDGNGYASGGAGGQGTTNYTWDQWGHCLTTTSARGVTTTNTYSFTNFAMGELTSTQTAGKQATTFTYYQPSGLLHTITSPLPGTVNGSQNVTTSYTYTALGNLASVTAPGNGTVTSKTTTYGYTTDGTYSQTEALGQPITVTDNLGKTNHVRYDSQSRAIQGSDALGNTRNISYNLIGQTVQTQAPASGQTGSGRTTTQNTYLYVGGPLTNTSLYDESGNLTRHMSPVYGAEGEEVSATGDVNPVTAAFDALYRPKTITDGNTHGTQSSYNAAGYGTSSQLANGDTYQATSWDADGNVLSSTDAKGVVTNYVYNDVESRLTNIQYPASPGLNVHITYDTYGRTSSVSDSTGSRTATYDDRDLPLNVTTNYVNAAGTGYLPALTLSYGYNADGSRSTLSTPGGSFSYGYDGRGLPSSLSNPSGETFGWTYLDNGWLWQQQSGSASTAIYTYNALGQVTELAHRKTSNNALLADFANLSHDAVGNRVSLSASLPLSPTSYSGSTSYSYDNKDQLTQETSTRTGGYSNAYGYDLVGNPTTWKGSAQTFNNVNQNTVGGTIAFDANGNPQSWNGATLTYDANNKLTNIGTALTAGYGRDGLRAWKQNSAGRTYFLYDGLVPVCELDGSGNVIAINTVGATGVLARHVNGTSGGSVFYAFDPQGSVSLRLDTSGNIVSSHVNEAWGTQLSSGTGYASDPYAGYGGQWGYYRDVETGLHLLGHRYYDVAQGRFINRDPIGYDGGINLYAYCDNGPLMNLDANGLQGEGMWSGGWNHGQKIFGPDPSSPKTDAGYHPGGFFDETGYFWGWLFGDGADHNIYGPNDPHTQQMRFCGGGNDLRQQLDQQGWAGSTAGGVKHVTAWWHSIFDWNGTEFEVGSFSWWGRREGNIVHIHVSNISSMSSFLGDGIHHLTPWNWDRSTCAMGGNVYQDFYWDEPVPPKYRRYYGPAY